MGGGRADISKLPPRRKSTDGTVRRNRLHEWCGGAVLSPRTAASCSRCRGVAVGAPSAGAPALGSPAGARLEDKGGGEEESAAAAAPAAARKSAIERRCCVHAFSGRCRSYRSPSNFCYRPPPLATPNNSWVRSLNRSYLSYDVKLL